MRFDAACGERIDVEPIHAVAFSTVFFEVLDGVAIASQPSIDGYSSVDNFQRKEAKERYYDMLDDAAMAA